MSCVSCSKPPLRFSCFRITQLEGAWLARKEPEGGLGMDGYGWRSLFLLAREGESSSAIPLTDGRPHSLSVLPSSPPHSLSLSVCSRKIMMSLGMTTKSRITLVSRHVQSATGSEKIIVLFSIYEYPMEYRVPSKCTTPSDTKVYFSTKSREDSLGPPLHVTWLSAPGDRWQGRILDLAGNTYYNVFLNAL